MFEGVEVFVIFEGIWVVSFGISMSTDIVSVKVSVVVAVVFCMVVSPVASVVVSLVVSVVVSPVASVVVSPVVSVVVSPVVFAVVSTEVSVVVSPVVLPDVVVVAVPPSGLTATSWRVAVRKMEQSRPEHEKPWEGEDTALGEVFIPSPVRE